MKENPELTLEILDSLIKQLPPVTYPKRIRISLGDYRRLREASDFIKIYPEQPGGYTFGFCGEIIMPDKDIADNDYEFDWGNGENSNEAIR